MVVLFKSSIIVFKLVFTHYLFTMYIDYIYIYLCVCYIHYLWGYFIDAQMDIIKFKIIFVIRQIFMYAIVFESFFLSVSVC